MYKIYTFFISLLSLLISAPTSLWAQAAGDTPSPTDSFRMFLPLIFIFVIFYFLIIRPQQKQAKQRQAMIKAVQKGEEIITTSGIHGRVTGVADDILTVEIADNCKIKMERSGIQSIKGKELPAKK